MIPPPILRHITPWRLLHFIDRHFDVCWASLVAWKMLGSGWSWRPDYKICQGSKPPFDYCGKFEDGVFPMVRRKGNR